MTRHRLAGHGALVHRPVPFDDRAIHRHDRVLCDSDPIAGFEPLDACFLNAILCHKLRRCRHSTNQRGDRRGRTMLGAEFEVSTQVDEREDHRRGVELRGIRPAARQVDHPRGVGHAHAQENEQIHVRRPVQDGPKSAHQDGGRRRREEQQRAQQRLNHMRPDVSAAVMRLQDRREPVQGHDRTGHRDGLTERLFLLPQSFPMRPVQTRRCGVARAERVRVVPRAAHGLDQRLPVRRRVANFDRRDFRRQVHPRAGDAVHGLQSPLHPRHAPAAGHPLDS